MNKIARYATVFGVLAGGCALLYRFGLSDEAKTSLKNAARSVHETYEQVSEKISDLYGTEVTEDMDERRREIGAQWERLGF